MTLYQIVEVTGLGVMESPLENNALTEHVYKSKEEADKIAKEMWFKNTSEAERKSGWCGLHYSVKPITVHD